MILRDTSTRAVTYLDGTQRLNFTSCVQPKRCDDPGPGDRGGTVPQRHAIFEMCGPIVPDRLVHRAKIKMPTTLHEQPGTW